MKEFVKKIFNVFVVAIVGIILAASTLFAQNFAGALKPEPKTDDSTISNVDSDSVNKIAPDSINNEESAVTDVALPRGIVSKGVGVVAAIDDSTYTLGINDVIEITVARHPEVSKQYIINSEGKVQYEFVGDIQIAGLTKKQAKDLITKYLSTYIVSPEVTIKIVGYNSKVVYIIGEVASPGKIYMRGDTITIREALLEAGLPLLSAATRKCRLITPSDKGNAVQKYVDVFALIYEGDLRQDFVMKPGDTLYIPATVLAKAMRVISPVTQPVNEAAGVARPVARGVATGGVSF